MNFRVFIIVLILLFAIFYIGYEMGTRNTEETMVEQIKSELESVSEPETVTTPEPQIKKVECYQCDGAGRYTCSWCEGSGDFYSPFEDVVESNPYLRYDNDYCSACEGDGEYVCNYCDGSGEVEDSTWRY